MLPTEITCEFDVQNAYYLFTVNAPPSFNKNKSGDSSLMKVDTAPREAIAYLLRFYTTRQNAKSTLVYTGGGTTVKVKIEEEGSAQEISALQNITAYKPKYAQFWKSELTVPGENLDRVEGLCSFNYR